LLVWSVATVFCRVTAVASVSLTGLCDGAGVGVGVGSGVGVGVAVGVGVGLGVIVGAGPFVFRPVGLAGGVVTLDEPQPATTSVIRNAAMSASSDDGRERVVGFTGAIMQQQTSFAPGALRAAETKRPRLVRAGAATHPR
jgi:hypothetical protein